MKYREELQNKERTTSYLKEPQKLVTARNDNDVEYKARLVSDDLSQIEELLFEEGVLRGKLTGLPDIEEAENLWYLSNSGKPKPEVTADRETKWFTTFGIPAQPPKL